VFVKESEHVVLPNAHAKKGKVVPVVGREADWWIDLQMMRLAKLIQARVQCFAGLTE